MVFIFLAYILEGFLCFAVGMPSASVGTCNAVSMFLLLLNLILLLGYIYKRYRKYNRRVIQALVFSALFKCFLVIWDYYGVNIFILPNSHADSESFHYWAMMFAKHYITEVENYSYVVGYIYRFFGVQRMMAQYFNVLLSFAGISLFERMLQSVELSAESRDRALILAALLPNYLIMASILIRECLISVLVCASFYCFLKWWKDGKLSYLFIAYLIDLGACYFHSGAIAVAIGMSFALVLTKRDRTGHHSIHIGFSSIVLSIMILAVFMFVFDRYSNVLFGKFQGLEMENIDHYIDEHNFYTPGDDGDSSAYTAGIPGLTGATGLAVNSPIRMIYFLWVPMPWMIRGVGDIIAFLGSSLFYGGTAFVGIYEVLKRRKEKADKTQLITFLIIALCGAFVFAWGTESAGSALRHREKFYYVYLMLFAVLQEYKREAGLVVSKRKQRKGRKVLI